MRLFPVLAALLVIVVIYAWIVHHDTVVAQLTGTPPSETEQTQAAQPPATDKGNDPGAQEAFAVVALHSKAELVDSAVLLRGRTEAARQVELRAQTSGQVVSEPLRRGAFIEKGQLLCQLDPGIRAATLAEAEARLAEARARVPEAQAKRPEAAARVEEAKARLTEAQSRLEEARINANAASKLSEGGYASQTRVASTEAAERGAEAALVSARAGVKSAESGLESVGAGIVAARAGVESAQAAVAAAQQEIARLEITAPFAGLLESDTAELGSLLQPGGLCATVIQLDPVKLVGFVSEIDVARLNPGAEAVARITSGAEVAGRVTFISRAADDVTRTFRVEIEVPNPDLKLRDGQSAEIRVSSAGTRAHLLPASALTLNDDGALGVRVIEAGAARFIPVEVIRDTPEGFWLSGLPETADIITIGQEYVTDGVRVAPEFAGAEP